MTHHLSRRIACLFTLSILNVASCSTESDQPTTVEDVQTVEASSNSKATGEVQWIDPKDLRRSPIRREKLSDEQMARIRSLQETFFEVDGLSVEKWVDNFKRDLNPDRELATWERMARAYKEYCSSHDIELDAKKEVFRVILFRSMAPPEEVLQRIELKVISREDAVEAMKGFE